MDQIPEFWRTEVYHPLSVHFPIALLLMGTIFRLSGLSKKGSFLNLPGTILLFIGTLTGWIAIYTGNLADGAVARTICDPTVLKAHENAAYTMTWLFTAAVLIDILIQFKLVNFPRKFFKMLNYLILITCLTGSGYLIYVGHLGASLVYQQAAGVHTPSENCSGF